MLEIFRRFYEQNSTWPVSVYFYRDALSQGQAGTVKELEVAAIKVAMSQCEGMTACKLTYIAVQKQHHVRIVPASGEDGRQARDQHGNVTPGVSNQSSSHRVADVGAGRSR